MNQRSPQPSLISWQPLAGGARRIDFPDTGENNAICFLPWCVSFDQCRRAGLLPSGLLAAYELPRHVVCSDPWTCADTLRTLAEDAKSVVRKSAQANEQLEIIGLSAGNFPAFMLANALGSRLVAISPGPRAEYLFWNSPYASQICKTGESNGRRLADYAAAFATVNPISNLDNLPNGCMIMAGIFDRVVPLAETTELVEATRKRDVRFVRFPLGHEGCLWAGAQYLRA